MTTLTRYRPTADLTRVRNNMDGILKDFFGNTFGEAGLRGNANWLPLVDLYETDDAFMIDVDLPGMKKSDVEVSFEDGVLHISGERSEEQAGEKPQYHRIERVHGRFSRAIELVTPVQADKIKATFKDGVLSIDVPKAEEVKPVRVQIA